MRFRLFMVTVTMVFVFIWSKGASPAPVAAQGDTPVPVREAAIVAMNTAIPGIGRPDSWRHLFLGGPYNDTALGCPAALTGTTLPEPVTVYQVWLKYGDIEYLWHVSSDGLYVRACDPKIPGSPAVTPIPTLSGTPLPAGCVLFAANANIRQSPSTTAPRTGTLVNANVNVIGRTADSSWYQIDTGGWVAASAATLSGSGCATVPVTGTSTVDYGECPADFAGYVPSRLVGFTQGTVEAGGDPNRVRSAPQTSAEVRFFMEPSSAFEIVNGPLCGNGIVWWEVRQGSQSGWTAESSVSDANTYYLAPRGQPQSVPPVAANRLTAANLPQITRLSFVAGTPPASARVVWSPDGKLLAYLNQNEVTLLSYPTLQVFILRDDARLQSPPEDPLTALAFDPTGRYLLAGYTGGALQVVDLNMLEIYRLPALKHGSPISDIAFSPDGNFLLTASGAVYSAQPATVDFSLRMWDWRTVNLTSGSLAPLFAVTQADGRPFLGAAFTPDGRPVGITDGDLRVYDAAGVYVANYPLQSTLGAPVETGLRPAHPNWFGGARSGVLHIDGALVRGRDVNTAAEIVLSPLSDGVPGSNPVTAFAQLLPASPTESPIVAVYSEASEAAEARITFFTPTQTPATLTADGVRDMAFHPQGVALAVLTESGLEIWGLR